MLNQIELKNFRQFYGDQTLECSTDRERNVTLIHAENGVGKTTLLNSIMWVFYGATTARFERKHEILNHEAAAEGKNVAGVNVRFSQDGSDYLVQRTLVSAGKGTEIKLHASKVEGGVQRMHPAPETFIGSVLPKDMAPYFFFDGEHAEAFAAADNQDAVATAIRSMLGCEVADVAIEDLRLIARDFGKDLGSIPGEAEMRRIETEIEELQRRDDQDAERMKEIIRQIDILTAQRDKIIEQLRQTEAAREIQKRRDEKEAQLKDAKRSLAVAEKEVIDWVGAKAIFVVARKLARETLDYIDDESLKGKIPSPYNEDFVRSLLDAKSCCCGRPLTPGTPEYGTVMAMVRSAANVEIVDRVVRARARVQQLRETAADAPRLFEAAQAKVAKHTQRIMVLEQEIGELGKRLEGSKVEEIAERERARAEKDRQISYLNQERGAVRSRQDQIARQIEEKRRDLDKLASKNVRARRIVIRRDLAALAAQRLSDVLSEYEGDARKVIQKQINGILEEAARRDYKFRFGERYSMELTNDRGLPVARSGGENQLMSLAFTSALVWFAQLRSKAKGDILMPGTIAPLILDSPFGQLDTKYRESTAKFVPKMASQVILLVSSSQGDDTVLKALEPYVGAEYLLVSENRSARGEKPEDRIVLRNREYHASLYSQPRNMTRIERVA
nr:AAA family ATPase [Azospirillum aestuarii]